MITLQGAIEKSPISQYWKNYWLDSNMIISYFGGSNNIFANCNYLLFFMIALPNGIALPTIAIAKVVALSHS